MGRITHLSEDVATGGEEPPPDREEKRRGVELSIEDCWSGLVGWKWKRELGFD